MGEMRRRRMKKTRKTGEKNGKRKRRKTPSSHLADAVASPLQVHPHGAPPAGLDHLERARLDDVELRGGAAGGGGRSRRRRRGRGRGAGKRRERSRGRRRRERRAAAPLRFRRGVPLPREDVPCFQADDVGRAGRCGRRRGALGPREQQEREQAPFDEGEVFRVGRPGRGRRRRR